MHTSYGLTKKRSLYHLHISPLWLLFCTTILCLTFLSACGGQTASKQTPSDPINAAQRKQGDTQLQTFQQSIGQIQKHGGDATSYQQQYDQDQQALQRAKTGTEYRSALTTLNTHIDAVKPVILKTMKMEGQNLQQKLQQQVSAWGQMHTYHDSFNNTNYPLGYEYGSNGIGGWVQDDLQTAQTVPAYQQAIDNLNMYLTNFQAMSSNAGDKTAYDQPHQADLDLLGHYAMMQKKVIFVSLGEQAIRVYDQGKLVKAFLATTGRPDKPSIPGTWWVEGKKAPTVFKATVPKSSPYWYPDTPINYAMQYHSDGYFLHDSWWRNDYGPTTNFPHQDSSGDSFSSQGSHGCINISKDNAAWTYNFVQLYTPIVIY